MEKTYNPALIQRTQRYMETHSISQNQFAAKVNLSSAALSSYLNQKYKGSVEAVERQLSEFFKLDEEAEAAAEKTASLLPRAAYVPTSISEDVCQSIRFAQLEHCMVVLHGDAGVGKSELALELISRGHGLVADDVVELARVAPTSIEGRCPGMLRDYLEVRGLGLLNIRTIFGETASRRKMKLKLIVHLQKHTLGDLSQRLPFENQTQEILGVPIRKVVFQVAAGRNLAVLLEAAVRNCILQLRGIDSMGEFIARQQQAVLDSDS